MSLMTKMIMKIAMVLLLVIYNSSPLVPMREDFIQQEQNQIIQKVQGFYTSEKAMTEDRSGKGFGEISFSGDPDLLVPKLKEATLQMGYSDTTGDRATEEAKGKLFIYEKPLTSIWGDRIWVIIDQTDDSNIRYQSGISPTMVESALVAFVIVWLFVLIARDYSQWRKYKKKAKEKENKDARKGDNQGPRMKNAKK